MEESIRNIIKKVPIGLGNANLGLMIDKQKYLFIPPQPSFFSPDLRNVGSECSACERK